ncbi:MAG: polymer-forming cytoskeletal protein, partial [Vitreoscilla sp.]
MTPLDLRLEPESPPASPAVLAARQRRALVVGLGGGRQSDSPMAKSSFAERRLRSSDTAVTRFVDPLPGIGETAARAASCVPPAPPAAETAAHAASSGTAVPPGAVATPRATGGTAPHSAPRSAPDASTRTAPTSGNAMGAPASAGSSTTAGLRLDDALVVPAGALVRGYLRCRALLLVGDVVGNVHCTAGPVVIRSGASLKGRLVASGDVYVCGTVGDSGGGAVITTRGKLTLAPGARVDGDVRSGWLDVYDGAVLQ